MNTSLLIVLADRTGWTLLHSLWQGTVVALLLALMLRLLRGRSAAARHAASMLALLVFTALVAGTAWRVSASSPSARAAWLQTAAVIDTGGLQIGRDTAPPTNFSDGTVDSMSSPDGASSAIRSAAAAPLRSSWRPRFEPLLPWMSTVWLIGVALLTLRHVAGWRRLCTMRRSGVPARRELEESFAGLLEKFGSAARVRLLESAEAAVPLLAGLCKPAVLLPIRVITGLGEREIEAILAHELAHLARRDAWSNFAQVVIETIFFYHPAVWWMGRRARLERENAADDLALKVCADRRVYAGALARLAELRFGPAPALAATGGNLLARIQRIVRPAPVEPIASGWSLGIPALLAAVAVGAIFHAQADGAKAIPVTPPKPATSDGRGADDLSQEKPAVWPAATKFELTLLPQVAEFEGFINYGSPIKTTSTEIAQTIKAATVTSIFDGQAVVLGELVQNVVPANSIPETPAKAPREAVRNPDDAKTWVADAFQLDDKAKREAAIERIRAAMTSGNAEEARTGVTAFVSLGSIEFDKASFRPVVRALLASQDVPTRAAAMRAFTMTGADPEDLPRIFALADDPAPEVREGLTIVIVQLMKYDLTGKPASDAILKLMANLPRDSRSVAHSLWGSKFSPEIEARVLEFTRDIDHASNSSVGYNFFYGSLSTQANKSEASCKRLIELLAHPDTTNIAGRSAWGLQQGVDRAQFPLVADAMMKVIEARSDGYLRNNALRCLRMYGNAAQAPALKALLEKPGVTGEMRKTLEETLAALEVRKVSESELTAKSDDVKAVSNDDPKPATSANASTVEKPEIEVEWKGKWWPATVLKKDGEKTQIHYIGYGSEWDEWVTPERIRPLKAKENETSVATRGQVYVMGQVRSPGPQEIPRGETLTVGKAILKAGGFGPAANGKKVKLVKGGNAGVSSNPIFINCVEIIDKGQWEKDVEIGPDDVIIVPEKAGAPTDEKVAADAERAAQLVEKNRLAARARAAEDRQRYTWEQLGEIEKLYQVANAKGKRSDEARTSLKQLLEKYDKANRTGCALLYLGQASEGTERLEYLTRAVEKFSDCYYLNGCQVGGYGRYVLALTLWDKGDKDKARALLAELKTTYKDTTDHRGRPMPELAEAAEKELEAQK